MRLKRFEAELALIGVTVLWGLTFPLIRLSVASWDPYHFVAFRFGIATLVTLPFLVFSPRLRHQVRWHWSYAVGFGALTCVTFLTQTIGLRTISGTRSAFITSMYVLFVPMLSPVFKAPRPSRVEWTGAAVALLGLYFMLQPDGPVAAGVGDALTLVCAFCAAIQVHWIQKLTQRKNGEASEIDPFSLAFFQFAGVTFYAMFFLPLLSGEWKPLTGGVLFCLVICAIPATVGTLWLQARYQKATTPTRASLIFALEPVFATVFGFFLLGERLSPRGFFGAGLIFSALVLTELWEGFRRG